MNTYAAGDAAAEEANRLIDENSALRGELAACRAALEAVERCNDNGKTGIDHMAHCPVCHWNVSARVGHKQNCILAAALSGELGGRIEDFIRPRCAAVIAAARTFIRDELEVDNLILDGEHLAIGSRFTEAHNKRALSLRELTAAVRAFDAGAECGLAV